MSAVLLRRRRILSVPHSALAAVAMMVALSSRLDAVAAEGCSICPAGIDEDHLLALSPDNETAFDELLGQCQQLVDAYDAVDADSDECTEVVGTYKAMCCPVPVENPCSVCPDGIDVDSLPVDAVTMCQESISFSLGLEAGSDECNQFKTNLMMCCPTSASNPCSPCPDGSTFDSDQAALDDDDSVEALTCGDLVSFLEEGSEDCVSFREEMGPYCCSASGDDSPAVGPAEDPGATATTPCSICPNGMDGGTVGGASFLNETELAQLATYCMYSIEYHRAFDAGSEECASAKEIEASCCPTPPEEACSVCPEGVDGDSIPGAAFANETELADMVAFCESSVELYRMFEADSEECASAKLAEISCCPRPPEKQCSICPEGVERDSIPGASFMNETEIAENLLMCKQSVRLYNTFEAGSEECESAPFMEMACCPKPHENPCSICPDGIDTSPLLDIISMSEKGLAEADDMCQESVTAAATLEANSAECGLTKAASFFCCPTLASNPCSICPDELTFNEDLSAVDDDSIGEVTCGGVALLMEEGSEECAVAKEELKDYCCSGPDSATADLSATAATPAADAMGTETDAMTAEAPATTSNVSVAMATNTTASTEAPASTSEASATASNATNTTENTEPAASTSEVSTTEAEVHDTNDVGKYYGDALVHLLFSFFVIALV